MSGQPKCAARDCSNSVVPGGSSKYCSKQCGTRERVARFRDLDRADAELLAERKARAGEHARLRDQLCRAAASGNPRLVVEELAEQRLELWLELPSANGSRPLIRQELDRLTRAIADGWEDVRVREAAERAGRRGARA